MTGQRVTGGEAVVRALKAHGVDAIFGIPGAHTLAVYDALYDEPGIRGIVARHEGGAGYMADGYARARGKPGVVCTITGPGATNVLTAVGGAFADSSPLLVISSQIPTGELGQGRGFLHEMRDQQGSFAAVTDWTRRVACVEEIGPAIDAAMAHFARGRPTPAYLEIPLDLLDGTIDLVPPHRDIEVHGARDASPAPDDLDEELVARAARALIAADHPVIYAGWGVIGADACAELAELAELLGAPVATSVKGKGALPDDHPLCLGCAWAAEVRASPALTGADVLLALGTRFSTRTAGWGRVPIPPLLIHVDRDPSAFGRTVLAQQTLAGDARAVLRRLIRLVREAGYARPRDSLAWGGAREAIRAQIADTVEARSPFVRRMLAALRHGVARDAIITNDNCLFCYWAGRYLPVYAPRTWQFPMQFCTLGYALPAAIGAKIARPERQVVALCGDGGFMFTCQELISAAALGLNLPVIVFNDASYGSVRENQSIRYGERHPGVELLTPDFVRLAEACQARGVLLEQPEQLPEVLAGAFAADRPTLIEVRARLRFP
ncbi:MAG TPA: thiamine pyrophosphate-binding protein [Chloroflexota bacterium]|nr:thiamine pyrophosphate-binding protein [Chloroflexota bacterium]